MEGSLARWRTRIARSWRPSVLYALTSSGETAALAFIVSYLVASGYSGALAGLTRTAYQLARGSGTLLVAAAERQFGQLRALVGSLVALAAAAAWLVLAHDLAAALIALTLSGLAATIFDVLWKVHLTASNPHGQARVLAWLERLFQLAAMAGALGAGWLAEHLGIGAVFAAWALTNVAAAALCLKLPAAPAVNHDGPPLHDMLRVRPPLQLATLAVGIGIIEGGYAVTLPLRLTHDGASLSEVGLVVAIGSLVTVIALGRFGALADRHGDRVVGVAGYVLLAFGYLLVAAGGPLWLVGLFLGVLMLGRNSALLVVRSLSLDWGRDRSATVGLALIELVSAVSRSVGGALGGVLADTLGAEGALVAFAAVAVLLALVASRIPKGPARERRSGAAWLGVGPLPQRRADDCA